MLDGRVTVLGCAAWLLLLLPLLNADGSNHSVPLQESNDAGSSNVPITGDDDGSLGSDDDVFEGNTTEEVPMLRRGLARLDFNNCGEETDPLYITGFDVTPNPIEIPGPLAVGISFRLNENVTTPVSVQLEMKKRLNFLFGLSTWFTIPCLPSGVGSCDYEDICKLALFSKDVCLDPDTDEEMDCKCPFHQGDWKMKPSTFNIPGIPEDIPSYLLQGEFSIKATMYKEEQQIACYSVDVDVNL
ncbi:ganglioside GM2 activator-like [Ornithodoros turicata]